MVVAVVVEGVVVTVVIVVVVVVAVVTVLSLVMVMVTVLRLGTTPGTSTISVALLPMAAKQGRR